MATKPTYEDLERKAVLVDFARTERRASDTLYAIKATEGMVKDVQKDLTATVVTTNVTAADVAVVKADIAKMKNYRETAIKFILLALAAAFLRLVLIP